MRKRRLGLTALVCSLALVGAMVDRSLAAQKKLKERASASAQDKAQKTSPGQTQRPSAPLPKKTEVSPNPGRQPDVLERLAQQTTTVSKPTGRKDLRQLKVSKKLRPKAEVQPRTDLIHHGLLENTQRYDPRPNSRIVGVPNPQTPDLTHDHFQELDRNQDGKIDPVERAFGRLDMDRDLHDRQPQ